MRWYEVINFCIMITTLSGSAYLFLRFKKLNKLEKNDYLSEVIYLLLNGLVFVQICDIITAISWAKNGMCSVVLNVPHYLYAIAAISKNIYFLIGIIFVIIWINKRIERHC